MTLRAVAQLALLTTLWWRLPSTAPVPAQPLAPIRLIERPCLHLGVRPAASLGDGVALTVQLSYCTPW